jgi:hypothetical protein
VEPEFAPGIPAGKVIHPFPTVEKPRQFEFAIHHHKSEGRAGEHYDLRIGDPKTGHAHSWAMKKLPGPGEITTAVQQPTHTVKYMDFTGRIESGYGKGQVDLARRDKVEVLVANDKIIRFNGYFGKNIEEYALRKTKEGWALHNVTTDRKVGPARDLPSSKPAYKSVAPEKIDPDNPDTELQAKIDGAHVLYHFKSPGTLVRVHSYRPTKRPSGIIEHTFKLTDFHKRQTTSPLRDTILRGELYAVDKDGKALPAARVGGLLNAGVIKSREAQKTEGKLVPVVFDVVKYRGKNVESQPYEQKKKILSAVVEAAPWLKLPRIATTPAEKRSLISDIQSGKEPSTTEGVVEWNKSQPVPRKTKFHEEHDVIIRSVFPEAGTKRSGTMAGGFEYSLTPKGPIVGRVGTGLSHEIKKDMLQSPSKYEGLKARVKAHKAPGHYALRAPAFLGFHLDQDIPEDVKMAMASVRLRSMNKTAEMTLDGKKVSENSVKKTVDFRGITIKLDRPKGSVLTGTDKAGKPWTRTYKNDYGFIPKTQGGDGEGLDVFLGPSKSAKDVYWAVQVKADGSFDEYKLFLGFGSKAEAEACYTAHIPKRFMKSMVAMSIEMLKAVLGVKPKLKMAMVRVSCMAELDSARPG